MGNGVCHKAHREKGAWFECKSLIDNIIYKKRCGIDCAKEISLQKAWRNYPGYREACEKIIQELGLSDTDLEA
jgi:hypothetical protein